MISLLQTYCTVCRWKNSANLLLLSPSLSERRRYCVARCLSRCQAVLFRKALCFTRDVFFSFFSFLSPGYLRAPSADRRETLPHDRNLGALYDASPKVRGPSLQRIWGPKTCKIRRDFRQLSSLIVNVSRTGKKISKIGKRPDRELRKKSGELWSTNYRVLDVSLDPPKLNFSGDSISALKGCWPLKF